MFPPSIASNKIAYYCEVSSMTSLLGASLAIEDFLVLTIMWMITINSEDQKVLEKPLQGAKAASHLFSRGASGLVSLKADMEIYSKRKIATHPLV